MSSRGTELPRESVGGRRVWRWAPGVVGFVVLGGVWQLIASQRTYLIPTLGAVWSSIWHNPGLLAGDAGSTLQEAVVGLACGFAAAFLAAVAMSQVDFLERALMPLAVVMNVTPLVAIAPGIGAIFGFGYAPKYILTAIIVFFPFLVNATIGLKSVDREALDVLRTLDASRGEILWRLRLPSSLPFLFAAARVCFPLSVVGAVVAEFSASGDTRGLGLLVLSSEQQSNLSLEYAAVFVLALVGILLTGVVVVAQRRLLRWHASSGEFRQ